MFVAIQKQKTGVDLLEKDSKGNIINIIPEYKEHKVFIAATREEIENNEFIIYDRIEEYEFAEMYAGVIYTDRTEYTNAKNEHIKQTRANLYAKQVDTLHAQKTKDTIMGEWTDEKEREYIAKVKELTVKIREENPYIE